MASPPLHRKSGISVLASQIGHPRNGIPHPGCSPQIGKRSLRNPAIAGFYLHQEHFNRPSNFHAGLQMANKAKQSLESKISERSAGLEHLCDQRRSDAASHRAFEQNFNEFSNVSKNLLSKQNLDQSRIHSQLENFMRKHWGDASDIEVPREPR
jgi:hypothetical protein